MMIVKFILLISILSLFSVSYAKQSILIDDELLKHDKAMQKKNDDCMKIKNIFKQTDCLNKVTDEKFDSVIRRGTKEYCQNNYLNKSFKERETILRNLKRDQKKARSYNDRGIDRKPGEVTAEMLQTEILIVEDSLSKNQANKMKKKSIELFGR